MIIALPTLILKTTGLSKVSALIAIKADNDEVVGIVGGLEPDLF